MTCHKQKIISLFNDLVYICYAENQPGSQFKLKEYNHLLKIISQYDGSIENPEIVEKLLIESGKKKPKSILTKIKEIFDTGTLQVVEEQKKNPLVKAVSELSKIYGFGPAKSKEIFSKYKISNLEDLKDFVNKHENKIDGKKIINEKQLIGLFYHNHLIQRIPFEEMKQYEEFLLIHLEKFNKKYSKNLKLSINGSYRRQCKDSGDIDVLITEQSDTISRKKFINYLYKIGFIKEILADGKNKFMGICKLSNSSVYRHIDIIETKYEQYPFGVLYFTGSGGFNTFMRSVALQKGFSMNEYEFSDKKTKIPITKEIIYEKIGKQNFDTEKDIFQFLELEYTEPKDRNTFTLSKLF